MQFVFLLLFNVFLGAVLYLVISLKLERSATEFRERRFRKEMDEIIKEFNVTAERNISLLESRIRVLRRLLEKTGDIRSLDVTLIEEESAETPDRSREEASIQRASEIPPVETMPREENSGGAMIKKGLLLLFDKIIDKLPSKRNNGPEWYGAGSGDGAEVPIAHEPAETAPVSGAAIIEKDLTRMAQAGKTTAREKERTLTEEEIGAIVASSDDRYKLVSLLSDGGCGVEEISHYSGIPAGEVRLVLNLHRGREISGG